MDLEFVIPLKLKDLLDVTTLDEHYHVSNVVPVNNLSNKITDCKDAMLDLGSYFIFDQFDTLYSILYNMRDIKFEVLHTFYKEIVIKSLESLDGSLEMLLYDDDSVNYDERMKMMNAVKMTFYIVVQFLKLFQDKLDNEYSLVIEKKGKKGGKLQKHMEKYNWDWEYNERLAFIYLNKLLKHPLYKLWDPPVVEEDFVNLVAGCCYATLEKPTITGIKLKSTREIIFEILATLIKSYNHALALKIKIVQLLRMHEHLASIMAQATIMFVKELNCRSLIKEIITEIIECGDTVLEGYAQDSSTIRTFANFIVEVAEKEPEFILACVNFLTPSLNCDPYSMRICVLTVLTELLIKVLKSDQLSDESRKMRDVFLDHLLDHITDCNVFVRSKVLRLWQRMWEANAVPKQKILPLLENTMQRLDDKSSQVVKYAIQLIRIMIENNMYGAKFDRKDIESKLAVLRPQLIELEEQEKKREQNIDDVWNSFKPEILSFLRLKLSECDETMKSSDESGHFASDATLEKKLKEIRRFIQKRKYEEAYVSIRSVETNFPEIYQPKLQMDNSDKVEYYCWLFQTIWMNDSAAGKTLTTNHAVDENKNRRQLFTDTSFDGAGCTIDSATTKYLIVYYEDFLKFIDTVNDSVLSICRIMMGDSQSEVLESIEFLVAAKRFELQGADRGLRSMLTLIFCKDKPIKDAVIAAYKTLYLTSSDEITARAASVKIIQGLFILLKSLTYEQKEALEEIIKQWVIDNIITQDCILVLWEIFSNKFPNAKAEDRRAAICILSMVSGGKIQTIKSNLNLLVKHAFDEENRKDYLLLKHSCKILKKLFNMKDDSGIAAKYPSDDDLFQNLVSIIVDQFTDLGNMYYPEFSMDAITVIYELSEYPDVTCENLLRTLIKILASSNKNDLINNNLQWLIEEEFLSRFILIVAHVTYSQWKYLENDIFQELRRRNHLTVQQKIEQKFQSGKSTKKEKTEQDIQQEFENNDMVAAADHRVNETIRQVCESEILYESNLVSHLWPLVVKVCKNPAIYSGSRLRSAAVISLSKLMMISSVFCEDHLQLFFTILKKCEDPAVQVNLLLAFGDLSYRFPNVVEPWTHILYENLRDESIDVRYTALLVISYLILNEMVKVKAQISDVALCIIDKDIKIRNLALQLFDDLGTKANVIYNVMPDIISRLSNPTEDRLTEENFQAVMKKLMRLIAKDRHFELLVEKLCHRLKGAIDERQSIDLSYCLTLVTYSERSIQKLIDNIPCYAETLKEQPEVRRNFETIISNCKKQTKFSKDKSQELLEELENKIDIKFNKGLTGLDDNTDDPLSTTPPTKTPARKRCQPVPASARKQQSIRKKTSKSAQILESEAPVIRRTKRKIQKVIEDSTDDSDS